MENKDTNKELISNNTNQQSIENQIKNYISEMYEKLDKELIKSTSEKLYFQDSITPSLINIAFPFISVEKYLKNSTKLLLMHSDHKDYSSAILITDNRIFTYYGFGWFGSSAHIIEWVDIDSIYSVDDMLFVDDKLVYMYNSIRPQIEYPESSIKLWNFLTETFKGINNILGLTSQFQQIKAENLYLKNIDISELIEKANQKTINVFLIDCDDTDSNVSYNSDENKNYLKFVLKRLYVDALYLKYSELSEYFEVYKYHYSISDKNQIESNQTTTGMNIPSILMTYEGKVLMNLVNGFENSKRIFNKLSFLLNSEECETDQMALKISNLFNRTNKSVKLNNSSEKIWHYIGYTLLLAILIFLYRSCN